VTRLLSALLGAVFVVSYDPVAVVAQTPWEKGFNFRGTDTYVTDGANETYVLTSDVYPITRNSVTFGYGGTGYSSQQHADRSASNDRRLAGVAIPDSVTYTVYFQVDLPNTGAFLVRLALGDQNVTASTDEYCQLRDTSTTLATFDVTHAENGGFFDTTGTEYTNATWPGSNTGVQYTYATTTFILKLTNETDTACRVAHVFITDDVGAATATPRRLLLMGVGR
jgi:hypothetical protein